MAMTTIARRRCAPALPAGRHASATDRPRSRPRRSSSVARRVAGSVGNVVVRASRSVEPDRTWRARSSHHSATAVADGGRRSARRARKPEGGWTPPLLRLMGRVMARPGRGRQCHPPSAMKASDDRRCDEGHVRPLPGWANVANDPSAPRSPSVRSVKGIVESAPGLTTSHTALTWRPGSPGVRSTWIDDVDRAGELVTDRRQRPGGRRLEDQGLESQERIERPVRMACRQRSVVTGVHRLDERQHLVAAHFADARCDPVADATPFEPGRPR